MTREKELDRMETMRGAFGLDAKGYESEAAEKAFISWGDYQWWHIKVLRDAIRARYGADSASEITKDSDGYLLFYYSDDVDFEIIGHDIGVSQSSISISSSSSSIPE